MAREAKGWTAGSCTEVFSVERRGLGGHTVFVNLVAFSPDGKRLAGNGGTLVDAGSRVTTVQLWDAASGQEVLTLRERGGGVATSFAIRPDGQRRATARGELNQSRNERRHARST